MSLKTAFFILILMCIRYFGFGTVKMGSFTTDIENGNPVLHWITEAEQNNKKFIIERSEDCITFSAIGTISGAENSTSDRYYNFIDGSSPQGVLYYRIVCVDNAEYQSFSNVIAVDNCRNFLLNNVYPCPFKNEINIILNKELLIPGSKIIIYGNSGREMYSCDAEEALKLDLSHLIKGTYYITVLNNNKRLVQQKILKTEE